MTSDSSYAVKPGKSRRNTAGCSFTLLLLILGMAGMVYAGTEDPNHTHYGVNAGSGSATKRNAFFGVNAGTASSAGADNAFIGHNAGGSNVGGDFNTFVGSHAGVFNTESSHNTFVGFSAGLSNTDGADNTYVGSEAGASNDSGFSNTFVGRAAGGLNTSGGFNDFFGYKAGLNNTEGNLNSFFGATSGQSNNTGSENAFFGAESGRLNTTGADNSFFGRSAGRNNVTGNSNAYFGGKAGAQSNANGNSFFGVFAGLNNITGHSNVFLGNSTGFSNSDGSENVFIGLLAGQSNASGNNNSLIGHRANSTDGLENAAALGSRAYVAQSNALVLGSIPGVNSASDYVDVGIGTSAPMAPLHIRREDGTLEFLRLESDDSSGAQDRAMMDLTNNGGIRFQFTNALTADAWRFQAGTGGNDNFEITKVGSGALEMVLQNDGDLVIAGALTQNSDVNAKKDIDQVDGNLVLARLDELDVSEWTYKKDKSGARHLGPMAQDFHKAFGLGEDETKIAPGDMAGINMAAIKAQQKEIRELKAENAAIKAEKDAEIAALEERLEKLEALMQVRR